MIVDLVDGREVGHSRTGFGAATSIAFSADGSRLAVVHAFSLSVHVLATESGRVLARLDNRSNVNHVAWNPRWANFLAAGLEDNTIQVWDVETCRPTVTLEGDTYNGLVVAFHPGGELLASRGWSGVLRLWDIRTGRQVLSMPSSWLTELHFARDGSRLSAHAAPGKAGILEVSYQTECRSLIREPGPLSQNTTALAIDHSGHHLAAACANGIIVWDIPTGTPVARLPVSGVAKEVLFDPAGSILTGSPMTLRWPVSSRTVDPTIGPPELLQWYQTRDGLSSSRDGRVVAIAIYNGGALVFDADRPANSRRILPQYDTRTAALSPDGRRLATHSHTDRTLKYWDTRTGRTVHDFPVNPPRGSPFFSPDGRFLATNVKNDGWQLLDIETWTSVIQLDHASGPATFSPDSKILAHETYYESYEGSIALVEIATGRELARIADPDGEKAAQIVFSPDGMKLIALLKDQPQIRIWDLRSVRDRLAKLNLDWSPPPPWGSAVSPTLDFELPLPPKYRVDRGQLDRWLKLAPIKRREQAVADAEELLKQSPGQAEVRDWLASSCNAFAWELLTGSKPDRDPPRALPLARRAIALAPESNMYLKTLGLALYRAGQHAEAIPVLERSLAANDNSSVPYDLFFLALCHSRLGDAVRARADFDRAVTWLMANSKLPAPADEELRAFRTEAEALLHASFGDLPDDVFAQPPESRTR